VNGLLGNRHKLNCAANDKPGSNVTFWDRGAGAQAISRCGQHRDPWLPTSYDQGRALARIWACGCTIICPYSEMWVFSPSLPHFNLNVATRAAQRSISKL